ncbi:MAG: flagellar hook-length control protein FliK [Clostridiales bacterium]|jgi:flagellar hook-length control protein FliK|nr:flagellar hook-length control protein FliK [Clostridiales bacterium]
MEVREWVAGQSILTPLVSAKTTVQTTSSSEQNDAFSKIFTQKRETAATASTASESLRSASPVQIGASTTPASSGVAKSASQTGETAKAENRSESAQTQPQADKAAGDVSSEEDVANTADSKLPSQATTEGKSSSETKASDAGETTEKPIDIREKIKALTGMTDEALNALMSLLKMDLDTVQVDGGLLKKINAILTDMDIDSALGKSIGTEQIEALKQAVGDLADALKTTFSDADSSDAIDTVVENLDAIQSALEQMEATSEEEPISFSDVVKAFATDRSESKPQAQTGMTETTAAAVSKPSESTSEFQTADEQPDLSTDEKTDWTLKTAKTTEGEKSGVNTDTVKATPASDKQTEVNANATVALHQVAMKQPNMNIATEQQVQTLKQDVMSQVVDAIKTQIKVGDNGSSMLVKLQPEELGHVELKLNVHKGVVMAEIKVENEMVKAAVESNLDDLKQNLSGKGYSVQQINVTIDSGKKEGDASYFSQSEQEQTKHENAVSADQMTADDLLDLLGKYDGDVLYGSTINYLG